MTLKIEIDKELHDRLKLKSNKTGISQLDLANRYIKDGLENDLLDGIESPEDKPMTSEEIDALLDHDWPEGDWISKKLVGLVESPVKTNAFELKKAPYRKGFL